MKKADGLLGFQLWQQLLSIPNPGAHGFLGEICSLHGG